MSDGITDAIRASKESDTQEARFRHIKFEIERIKHDLWELSNEVTALELSVLGKVSTHPTFNSNSPQENKKIVREHIKHLADNSINI